MSEQFRILVVEDEETLNQSIVNSLRRDGYVVQGVRSGAEAIRILWTEECDVVISDQKTPGADGFELLQWLRTNRPNIHMIMLSEYGSPETRTHALESGAVSYLEKPLNLHLLKEELRRLLQQTGFSASLDSFDLLDVIQIINMSRKSIALLINTGLEERGVLRFQDGELIWAEYGILRGEEAFFALAAHMNGTVIHQPWNEQIQPNVSQPLSRLIFQALQYRSKYAVRQQQTGAQVVPGQPSTMQSQSQRQTQELMAGEIDDTPFVFAEPAAFVSIEAKAGMSQEQRGQEAEQRQEWWQETGHGQANGTHAGNGRMPGEIPATPGRRRLTGNMNNMPSVVEKTPGNQRPDLPAWLTEQAVKEDSQLPLRPAALSSSTPLPAVPPVKASPAEWQLPVPPAQAAKRSAGEHKASPTRGSISALQTTSIPATPGQPTQPTPVVKVTEQLPERLVGGRQKSVSPPTRRVPRQGSAEWQPPEQEMAPGQLNNPVTPTPPANGNGKQWQTQGTGHNYPALISALQTLGYSVPGFVAAAVVGLDGQPIAQVAVDDLDISQVCGFFSTILLAVLRSLEQGSWGGHEETIISSESRHILLRIVGNKNSAFQVLITTRETEPSESLEVMANVEGAISAALH